MCTVQAGYARDEALQEKVKSEWTLARIQAEVLKEVSKKLDIEARRGAATDFLTTCAYQLNREALSPTVLFNNFCVVRVLLPLPSGFKLTCVRVLLFNNFVCGTSSLTLLSPQRLLLQRVCWW